MNSGGAGACRSRGSREARPNPVSRIQSIRAVHQEMGGLQIPVDEAARVEFAEGCGDADGQGQEGAHRHGRHRAAAPAVRRLDPQAAVRKCRDSRSSARGRTAHAASSASFKSYSWARRSRQVGLGCSEAGSTTSTELRLAIIPPDAKFCRSHARRPPTRPGDGHLALHHDERSTSNRLPRPVVCQYWAPQWLCTSLAVSRPARSFAIARLI